MDAKELNLLQLQNKAVGMCGDFFRENDFKFYETDEILQEMGKIEYSRFTIADKIYKLKTMEEVAAWYKEFTNALIEVKKRSLEKNHEKEKAKILSDKLEKEKKEKEESFTNYSEQVSKNENVDEERINSLNKAKEEETKRESEKKAENSNPNLPQKGDSFDEKTKSKYTQEAERELKKHNISDQKLNKKLGVDDWKSEINESVDWSSAQTFWFSIKDAIEKISREIICDNCKKTESPIIDYNIPSKKKKFCSWDCRNAWEEENKNKKDSPNTSQGGKFGISDMSEFFSWMKKIGVTKISFDFNANQVVIECNGGKQLGIADSGLSPQLQEELTTQLKSTKEPITFSEVSRELGYKNKKNGNAAMIGFVVVIGVILIVIVGVLVTSSRNKKKHY